MLGFRKNVDLGSPLKLSAFRKVAIGTWRSAGDPSVYGIIEYDVRPAMAYLEKIKAATGEKITLTHFVGKAVAQILKQHPELNCILRFGKLYPRRSIDVFFQVASDSKGDDLSGATIRNADQKSLVQLARELQGGAREIREKGDPAFKKMKSTLKMIPGILSWPLIQLTAFIQYSLNLWSPAFGTPPDTFGSIMITSIGPLGLEFALAPLVPYSRVPCVLTVGAVHDAPVVVDGRIEVAPVVQLGVTFDHRLIDGVHAAKMSTLLKKIFADPEALLG
jgi:pyruvate dehydrogenase E2 component (dihydrolipoamide acetyltransferase)